MCRFPLVASRGRLPQRGDTHPRRSAGEGAHDRRHTTQSQDTVAAERKRERNPPPFLLTFFERRCSGWAATRRNRWLDVLTTRTRRCILQDRHRCRPRRCRSRTACSLSPRTTTGSWATSPRPRMCFKRKKSGRGRQHPTLVSFVRLWLQRLHDVEGEKKTNFLGVKRRYYARRP